MAMLNILVLNNKGGSGKTTVATNLASHYASKGLRCALLDLDRQRSSLNWLDQRPDWRPTIEAGSGWDRRRFAPGTNRVVIDAPAQIQAGELRQLLNRVQLVLVPVLPSPIDIRAATDFIARLLVEGRLRNRQRRIGIIANRLRERTRVSDRLLRFLDSLSIPLVACLRDSQNYLHAAERGIGVFEMESALVRRDLDQWQPLTDWLERRGTELAAPAVPYNDGRGPVPGPAQDVKSD
jgi:chromosome partitioning protein